jgi:hypothetical protein
LPTGDHGATIDWRGVPHIPAQSQILNVLKGGVLSRLQIRQKLTELTGTQLQNALDRLRKANKIEKVGHGLYGVKE